MKKIWVLLLCVILAGMTGCADSGFVDSSREDDGQVTRIVWWHYYSDTQDEELGKLVKEYNETAGAEKNVRVEAVSQGSINELGTKLDMILNDSTNEIDAANMFLAYRDMAGEIMENNPDILVNYRDYFTEEELEGYHRDYIEEGEFGDKLYIIPVAKSTELLFINQTMLNCFFGDNPGYTTEDMKTWQTLENMAEAYYNWTDALTPDVPDDGLAFIGMDNLANYFIAQNHARGSSIYSRKENGEVIFDLREEYIKELFYNYYIPFSRGYYGSYEKYRSDDLRQGYICGYIGSISSTAYFPDQVFLENGAMKPIEMGVYEYPCLSGGKRVAIQQGAGIAILDKGEKANQACIDFIKWLTFEKGMEYSSMMSYMPVSEEVMQKNEVDSIVNEKVRHAVRTGLDECRNYEMVRGFDFDHSFEIRMDLEEYFAECLRAGREEYLNYLSSGMTAEEAQQAMEYEKKADTFYRDIVILFTKDR